MDKNERKMRRKRGIRKKIQGTKTNPRITVYRSNRHIYVQAIDDDAGKTISFSSDTEAGVKRTCDGAFTVGKKLAEKLVKGKIKRAVFDRNGYIYHGIVKSIAEGVRKSGIKV